MFRRVWFVVFVAFLSASIGGAADTPDPREIVNRVIAAAGGEEFTAIGVLQLEVEQEEYRNDGTSTRSSFTVSVDTRNLANLRIDYPTGVVVAATASGGWSADKGVIDERPQTPMMAQKTLNQTIFPILLPYTLEMPGVWPKEVRETIVDGREAWVISLPFAKGFFVSPILTTTWLMVVAKDDFSIISIEFVPPVEYRKVTPEGIRYRTVKYDDVEGAQIPSQVLAIGIDAFQVEGGHHRVTRIKPSVRSWEPGIFLNTAQLEALEED